MVIIGLTGGIATGKSTVTHFFAYHGVPTVNADAIAHELLTQADVIERISEFAPSAVTNGKTSRQALGQIVFNNATLLMQLEQVLHPLIRDREAKHIHHMACLGKKVIVLDIPLLFETRHEDEFDMIISTSCPERLQHLRALARPTMTEAKLKAILAHQLPAGEKAARADVIISTGLNKAHTMRQVRQLLMEIMPNA
jgi:dephospho-CoA kinase